MTLRIISVSKILFDDRWEELSSSQLGSGQMDWANFMIVLRARSEQAKLKIKIVGYDTPQELSFRALARIRVGSGMIMYKSLDLEKNGITALDLDSLNDVF